MEHSNFHDWCCLAVEKIRYFPDREAVYDELKAHLEDRYDAYRELGLSDTEATQRALNAMGDACSIASQLAEIHRPFWGYLYGVSKWIFRILLVVILFLMIHTGVNALFGTSSNPYAHLPWHPYEDVQQEDEEALRTRVQSIAPDISYSDSGYTITLSKAAHWLVDWTNPNLANSQEFYFCFDITTPWPWAEEPTFIDWIWAEDSLGNHYYGDKETLRFYDSEEHYHHYLSRRYDIVKNNPFSYSCYLEIQIWKGNRVEGIEWIDLHYDRDGRDMVFHVDLTGGDSGA